MGVLWQYLSERPPKRICQRSRRWFLKRSKIFFLVHCCSHCVAPHIAGFVLVLVAEAHVRRLYKVDDIQH